MADKATVHLLSAHQIMANKTNMDTNLDIQPIYTLGGQNRSWGHRNKSYCLKVNFFLFLKEIRITWSTYV